MARTQASDYDAKREAITEQAAMLFAKKGFAGASISELAQRCSVSKSLIYHYYNSKEEILFDIMDVHVTELLRVVESHQPDSNCLGEDFCIVTKALLRCYVGAADKQKVLLYELSSLPPDLQKTIVQKQRRIINLVEFILAKAIPAPRPEHDKMRMKVMLYFGMLNWTHTWFKPKGKLSRDELAEMAADILLRSL